MQVVISVNPTLMMTRLLQTSVKKTSCSITKKIQSIISIICILCVSVQFKCNRPKIYIYGFVFRRLRKVFLEFDHTNTVLEHNTTSSPKV